MKLIFFDGLQHENLLPLTFTRPIAELRWGILSLREKWLRRLDLPYGYLTADYLQPKFPYQPEEDNLYLYGGLHPSRKLLELAENLASGDAWQKEGQLLMARLGSEAPDWPSILAGAREFEGPVHLLQRPYDLFRGNAEALEDDFELLTAGRRSAAVSPTNVILGERFFAEEEATAECATFNTNSGPVYLAAHSQVMEGSVIRGGFALLEHATLKMMAKIYGATTVGPHCKVGGEVNNSIFQGYSNKGHDGFLGNSVIGEWCNLGADTNNSNLKNNYDLIKIWSYVDRGFRNTGLQFCGLIMGDHSKSGINTMFNTGTVVGVSANVFGSGFPRTFIPSFSWGGAAGFSLYLPEKAFATAERMMARRNVPFDQTERDILQAVFDKTADFR